MIFLLGCNKESDAAIELDITKLGRLLNAVSPLIAKGFGESEWGQIERDFQGLPVDGTKQYAFPITYGGSDAELRIRVRKEDVDVIEIHFFAPPKLADQIREVMRTTPLDVSN